MAGTRHSSEWTISSIENIFQMKENPGHESEKIVVIASKKNCRDNATEDGSNSNQFMWNVHPVELQRQPLIVRNKPRTNIGVLILFRKLIAFRSDVINQSHQLSAKILNCFAGHGHLLA